MTRYRYIVFASETGPMSGSILMAFSTNKKMRQSEVRSFVGKTYIKELKNNFILKMEVESKLWNQHMSSGKSRSKALKMQSGSIVEENRSINRGRKQSRYPSHFRTP